jgi:Wadjet protein JetA
MLELFKVVPPNLFRPLAAPGAPVYARALFVLFAETKRHQQPLSRDLALSLVMEILSDPEVLDAAAAIDDEFEETDHEGEEGADEPGRIQARGSALLRALVCHGWLRVETQSDFSQQYILPDYAFRLLETLEVIASNEPPALRGMIYGIHDLLQMALKDGDEHIRIPQAHRQMQRLMNGLKELQHNIGAHIDGVLQRLQASQILEQFFTNYRQEIVDRVYHQLRTTDHVARFRLSALDALAKIEREEKISAAASRLRAGGEAESIESAAQQLIEQIREIREAFDALDQRLQTIDARHSQFVSSAVRAVELHLTASSTTSGQLHSILSHLLTDETGAANQPLPDLYRRLVSSFELGLVNESSLAPPKRAAVAFVPEVAAAPSLSDEEIAESLPKTPPGCVEILGSAEILDHHDVAAATIHLAIE